MSGEVKADAAVLRLMGPLCQAVVQGDAETARSLLARKADANLSTPHDGRTALHVASACGQLEMVKLLLNEAGAELKRDAYGMLPLHDAKMKGHTEVRAFLQEVEFKQEPQSPISPRKASGADDQSKQKKRGKAPLLAQDGTARKMSQDWREYQESPHSKQMEVVVGLLFRDGIFAYHSIQAEVQHYYNDLGIHPVYFENFTAAQITRHVQCLMAAKRVALTRGERQLEFNIQDEHNGFFLATLAPSTKHRESTAACDKYLIETISKGMAFRVTFMASEESAFSKGSRDERLGILVVDRTHWEPGIMRGDDDEDLFEETDLQRIATTDFLKSNSAESIAMHQRLVERAVMTRSMAVEVFPGAAFPGPYKGGFVVVFSIYVGGGRQFRPLFGDLQELLWHIDKQPKRYYIDNFANGTSSYALYFPFAAQEDVDQITSAMRFIQFTKRTPSLSGELWNSVLGGDITPEQSIYLLAAVKFAYSFFPREQHVQQYEELRGVLHRAENRQKLDELYLQTVREIITPTRIYEIICRNVSFGPKLFADFKRIATGEVKPFFNEELAKEIDERVPDKLDATVLRTFIMFNHSIRITNFFRTDLPPSAMAFRLDPAIVLAGRPKTVFPETPFGIYFVMGRFFYGFHVRFREIARGGLRCVRSRDRPSYNKNASTLFEECYNLAYTQQLKNKDIPEGGAKGVILLDISSSGGVDPQSQSCGRDCFVKYVDSLLDCMLLPDGVKSHLDTTELLFFGPDEGTADCMDIGARRARQREHPFWKALTTGKSAQLGGVPHDVYGITTRGVRTYARELQRVLGLEEKNITKVQTGGPDGDLGSNEILQSCDKTVALVDISGVAFDPAGLHRPELERLARGRLMISSFNRSSLGPGGFLVLLDDKEVTLPDGSWWRTGIELRDRFIFTKYGRADMFVPCGGRPATISLGNIKQLLADGAPWKMMVEGANLFCTEDARRKLEEAGVHVFKDSSANKGGVTSSSLEVLASLAMTPQDHDRFCSIPSDDAPCPEFYSQYVEEIIRRIEENCTDEFKVIWEATQDSGEPDQPHVQRGSAMPGDKVRLLKIDASRKLSQEITLLQDHIAEAELTDELIHAVLPLALPKLLVDHCGMDRLLARLPPAYVKATVAYWLASKYVYEHGVLRSSSFAFHSFMERFYTSEA